jgi:ribosomal protein S18 acetylase RimI-like enzyme
MIQQVMEQIEFKPASPDRYELIRQFLIEAGWSHRVGSVEQFEKMMNKTDRTMVAWSGMQVVGFARALCDDLSNGYISMVAVAANRRKQGIGRQLVERLIGDSTGITWVLRAGRESGEFWKRMGFEESEIAMERVRTSSRTS